MINSYVMSKQGDTYEPSFNTLLQYNYKNGQIASTIDTYERLQFILVPFFLVFKLFGVCNQKEMTEMIIEDDAKSEDKTAEQLKTLIQ